jgi:hypothetical protein
MNRAAVSFPSGAFAQYVPSSNSGPRSKPWKSFSFYWNPVSKTGLRLTSINLGENIDELRNGR